MAYRTEINGMQVFGNNEYYEEWIEFIKGQGISVNEELCYEGDITDFDAAVTVCEKIVMRLETELEENRKSIMRATKNADPETKNRFANRYPSLFDLSNIKRTLAEQDPDFPIQQTLFGLLKERIEYGYLFMPIMLYMACKSDLEPDPNSKRLWAYKLKPGTKIHVRAG